MFYVKLGPSLVSDWNTRFGRSTRASSRERRVKNSIRKRASSRQPRREWDWTGGYSTPSIQRMKWSLELAFSSIFTDHSHHEPWLQGVAVSGCNWGGPEGRSYMTNIISYHLFARPIIRIHNWLIKRTDCHSDWNSWHFWARHARLGADRPMVALTKPTYFKRKYKQVKKIFNVYLFLVLAYLKFSVMFFHFNLILIIPLIESWTWGCWSSRTAEFPNSPVN